MEVSWTDHSHIIGREGRSIKSVSTLTNCHIHFPDSNRFSETEKCNQVSIAGAPQAVETARAQVRVSTVYRATATYHGGTLFFSAQNVCSNDKADYFLSGSGADHLRLRNTVCDRDPVDLGVEAVSSDAVHSEHVQRSSHCSQQRSPGDCGSCQGELVGSGQGQDCHPCLDATSLPGLSFLDGRPPENTRCYDCWVAVKRRVCRAIFHCNKFSLLKWAIQHR